MFEDLLRGWDGEQAVIRHDAATGAWMFVGVHSTVLGPAMGGTRMKVYRAPADGLGDVLRLSQAMTMKQAVAGLDFGGGKAVLAVAAVPEPGSPERRDLLLRYAALVDGLRGTYVTAADMNTGQDDMDVISERTVHVLGRSRARGGSGDPADGTAVGVFHGLRASVRHAFGSDDLGARTVLVQGVGAVGMRLAELVHEAGASVLVADVDEGQARAAAERCAAEVVPVHHVASAACDVYAPCAIGGVLTAETIPLLRCRVVAGAANNQLATPRDAGRLHERGILYAPDYVINAGGVIHLAGYETMGWDEPTMRARLAEIGSTLTDLYERADRDGTTPAAAADRFALERIEVARAAAVR